MITLVFAIFLSSSVVNAATDGESGTNTNYINDLPCKITESGKYLLNTTAYVSSVPAIEILVNDVILDGNGNYIEGDAGVWNGNDCGVRAFDVSGIVIKNMDIRAFSIGIYFSNVSDSTIFKNKLSDNKMDGIDIYEGCENILIEQNIISGSYYQLWADDITNIKIVNNEIIGGEYGIVTNHAYNANIISNEITLAGIGIGAYASEDCDIHGNKILNCDNEIVISDSDFKESGNKILE